MYIMALWPQAHTMALGHEWNVWRFLEPRKALPLTLGHTPRRGYHMPSLCFDATHIDTIQRITVSYCIILYCIVSL